MTGSARYTEPPIDQVGARTAELADNLARLRQRISAACRVSRRNPDTVRLLPVTKFFPASDIEILYGMGCREFGESREQEATAKVANLGALPDIGWHMVGRLQRNKARVVARWARTVHSVDSARLASALATAVDAALAAGERIDPVRVLIQVSLDSDPQRGGVAPDELLALADRIAATRGLHLAGLMAIPPIGVDIDASFARLATLHTRLGEEHPAAVELSAGMSDDLESAIEHGSTCVRVGTALMGARPITSA